MSQPLVKFSCVFFLASAAVTAQPLIQSGGVVNAATNAPDGLPNAGIAQGSIFLVKGSGLGDDNPAPINLLNTTTFPLPAAQGLNGTSVQVKTGNANAAINAIMLYESATTLAAILPSTTPLGVATVTVTYNGQASAPAVIHVVARAFGVFSLNQTGNGPGYIVNINSSTDAVLNRVTHAAQPGQTVILVGTGLGAVRGDETQQIFPGNLIQALDTQVFVGGKPGIVMPTNYIGRSCCAGVDELDFEVPAGVEGCYVPVVVLLNNVVSNTTTMSISSKGAVCSEPTGVGLSLDDLQQMVSNQSARVGQVTLTRLDLTVTNANGQQQVTRSDSGAGTFLNMTPNQFVSAPGSTVTPGGCVVQTFSGAAPPPPTVGDPIDIGGALNVNGPAGGQQLSLGPDGVTYGAQFGSSFLEPGAYTLDDGGGGSSDTAAGPFQAALNSPAPFRWVDEGLTSTVTRSIPLRVTWTGGDPNGAVAVVGFSIDPNGGVGAAFNCMERPGAGTFQVPPYVLSWMPANAASLSAVIVANVVQSRFSAPGLDAGYFNYQVGAGRNVQFVNPMLKAAPIHRP